MEALFCINAEFFLHLRREMQRDRQNVKKVKDRLRPGIPQRAQQCRKKEKGTDRPAKRRKKSVQCQPAPVYPQGKEEDAEPRRNAVERIKQPCQPGQAPTQGAQQIVKQGKGGAQSEGDEQRTELRRVINAHAFSRRAAGTARALPERFHN